MAGFGVTAFIVVILLSVPRLSALGSHGGEHGIDLVIVPGLQLNYSDCSPRKVMEYRVERAVTYAATVPNPHYLLSGKDNGNIANECFSDNNISEASTMGTILVAQYGVDGQDITLEEEATTTVQNGIESKLIVDQLKADGVQIDSMALISSNYHIHRGSSSGNNSAPFHFNNAFGPGTFIEGVNAFESSKMEQASVWLPDALGANNDGNILWNTLDHVRLLGDVDGDGFDDIVAMGEEAVSVALSDGSQFGPPSVWLDCGFSHSAACGGWGDSHVRTVGDVNGDGLADLVGFGNNDVLVHLSDGSGFGTEQVWSQDFGSSEPCCGAGTDVWNNSDHIRTVADVNGDGRADIVAFGNNEVVVALSNGTAFDGTNTCLTPARE